MDGAIQVSNLSKLYKQYQGQGDLLREMLLGGKRHHELWALRDISFEIAAGESFGLIGDNGAGKSTLLKILCGTTFPTSGNAQVEGLVSALLELGAGFHPEFSGRTNIYFSGALMGYNREEIRQREDEIIAFSELEDFIEQPVKTYSSGMNLRLGFAVATGFDPSVLVIDEALAVGDQGFQKKCTDRILDFRERGKTILFCSHNLYQVRKMCDRTLWLDQGRMVALGESAEVADRYQDVQRRLERRDEASAGRSKIAQVDGSKGAICRIDRFQLTDEQGQPCDRFESGQTVRLEAWAHFREDFEGTPGIGVSILRNDGTMVYTTSSTIDGQALEETEPGLYYGAIVFPRLPLLAGSYCFTIMLTDQANLQVYDVAEEVLPFIVSHKGPDFGLASLDHFWDNSPP